MLKTRDVMLKNRDVMLSLSKHVFRLRSAQTCFDKLGMTLKLFLILILTNCTLLQKPHFILTQFAPYATYIDKTLELENTTNNLVYFSDSKNRIIGHIAIEDFIKKWQQKHDKNFPDAAISYYDKNYQPKLATVEINSINAKENSVFYKVRILSGKLEKNMQKLELFIEDEENLADIMQF